MDCSLFDDFVIRIDHVVVAALVGAVAGAVVGGVRRLLALLLLLLIDLAEDLIALLGQGLGGPLDGLGVRALQGLTKVWSSRQFSE